MFNNLFDNIRNGINNFADSMENPDNPINNFIDRTFNFEQNNNTNNSNKNSKPIPCKEHLLFNIDIERNGTCSVCLDDFNEGDVEIILPCGHIFHKNCITPWFKKDNSCPNCRITSNYGKKNLSMKLINSYYKKIHNDNIYGIHKNSANIDLINTINVKKIKFLLDEFKIDYSKCIQKSELLNLIKNEIFFCNKSSKFIKNYLKQHKIDSDKYLERINLLKIVALIRLINRFY
tara:strand:+ start:146 stop:844 length:699 start_codon:yes stop_codon:yes gene_type:complete